LSNVVCVSVVVTTRCGHIWSPVCLGLLRQTGAPDPRYSQQVTPHWPSTWYTRSDITLAEYLVHTIWHYTGRVPGTRDLTLHWPSTWYTWSDITLAEYLVHMIWHYTGRVPGTRDLTLHWPSTWYTRSDITLAEYLVHMIWHYTGRVPGTRDLTLHWPQTEDIIVIMIVQNFIS